jgi:hypothetical protein
LVFQFANNGVKSDWTSSLIKAYSKFDCDPDPGTLRNAEDDKAELDPGYRRQVRQSEAHIWNDLRLTVPSGTVGKMYQDEMLMAARRVKQTERAQEEVFCKRCQAENMMERATGTREG